MIRVSMCVSRGCGLEGGALLADALEEGKGVGGDALDDGNQPLLKGCVMGVAVAGHLEEGCDKLEGGHCEGPPVGLDWIVHDTLLSCHARGDCAVIALWAFGGMAAKGTCDLPRAKAMRKGYVKGHIPHAKGHANGFVVAVRHTS